MPAMQAEEEEEVLVLVDMDSTRKEATIVPTVTPSTEWAALMAEEQQEEPEEAPRTSITFYSSISSNNSHICKMPTAMATAEGRRRALPPAAPCTPVSWPEHRHRQGSMLASLPSSPISCTSLRQALAVEEEAAAVVEAEAGTVQGSAQGCPTHRQERLPPIPASTTPITH